MNICGIRPSPRFTTLVSLSVTAVVGMLSLIGCGTGSTYSPKVKTNVPPVPNFTIAVTPSSSTVAPGNTANYTVTITETGGFDSPITLSASGLPTGATATFGGFTPTASGETAPFSITTSDSVEEDSAAIAGTKQAKPVKGSVTRQVTPTGSSTVIVTATGGGITQTANVTLDVVIPPSYTISLAPASSGSNIVAPGGTAKYIVTVTSIGGFSSPVALSASGNPANTTLAFGATSITPTAAGATTTLNVVTVNNEGAVTLPGFYTLTATGTSGTATQSANSAFTVGVFSVTLTVATDGSGTVSQGQTAHFIVTVNSIDGFAPLVTLTPPAVPTGCVATFGSSTITPTAAGATTTLTITTTAPGSSQTTPTGGLNIEVGASGGGWTTAGSAQFDVTNTPYFTISVTPPSGAIQTPGSGAFTVTVTSVNGYNDAVTLSALGLPANTTGSFASPTVTPTSAGVSTTFTLTASAAISGTDPFQISGIGINYTTTTNTSATFTSGG